MSNPPSPSHQPADAALRPVSLARSERAGEHERHPCPVNLPADLGAAGKYLLAEQRTRAMLSIPFNLERADPGTGGLLASHGAWWAAASVECRQAEETIAGDVVEKLVETTELEESTA